MGTISQPLGPGTLLTVIGTHVYNVPRTYPVAVVIRAADGRQISAASTATVAPDLTVYNTRDDANPGSLRHAFNELNQGLGSVITFRIPGTGPFVIAPATPLPVLARPVLIDATTEESFVGRPLVVVSGANLPAGGGNDGITLAGGFSTVKGLVINGFSGVGLVLENQGGDTVENNAIGTDASGTNAVPNFQGVLILGTSGNRIGGAGAGQGNLISGNTSVGIQIFNNQMIGDPTEVFAATGPAANNVLLGNRIGTNAAGTAPLPNSQGVFINDAPSNTIGGTGAGAGNVISGNTSVGVQILGPNATGNVLLGNAIGTNAAHTLKLGNGSGVFVFAAPGNAIDLASNTIEFNASFAVQVRPLSAGPTVESVVVQPVGGTSIVGLKISFTTYLSRASAANPANYLVALLRPNLKPRVRRRHLGRL